HHHLRVLDGEDEVGGVPGGPARVRHRPLVHQDEVTPPQQRQVMHQAVADDARPYDHGTGPGRSLSHAAASCPSVRVATRFPPPSPPGPEAAPPGCFLPPPARPWGRTRPRRRDCWRRGRRHAGRDDSASYSTGISLLIRPRSMPCRRRMSRATMNTTIASTYIAPMYISDELLFT